MIVIYHNRDLDGFTSGAIVKKKYPDAKLIGFDYGQTLPMEQIPKGEPIIMIDVSLPMSEKWALAERSGNMIWIDHHISAIKDFENYLINNPIKVLRGILENGISACEGGWKYLFPNEPMPKAVELLGEYDTWRNGDKERWEKEILPFQFGMRLYCNSPETFPTELLNAAPITSALIAPIINEGNCVLKYQAMINETQCKKNAFPYVFNGLRAICLNGGGFNSDVFKSVYNEAIHDIMMPFQFDGKQWTFSLYTTKEEVDCSAIAKSQGGGGHKKAAGFQKKYLSEVFRDAIPQPIEA